ncbi:MAG: hypothetical protein VB089_22255 [Anaerolineaceae bacterium]|nr:hypothetical protein [Anaerolineaceae bacterium]
MDAETPLSKLQHAVITQKKANLAEPPDDVPGLVTAYHLLRQYDENVSQVVIAALQSRQPEVTLPDPEVIGKQIDRAMGLVPEQYKRLVDQYRNYKQRLDETRQIAFQVLQDNRSGKSSTQGE